MNRTRLTQRSCIRGSSSEPANHVLGIILGDDANVSRNTRASSPIADDPHGGLTPYFFVLVLCLTLAGLYGENSIRTDFYGLEEE